MRNKWNASLIGMTAALLVSFSVTVGLANAGKPAIDPSYANGQTVYMIGPHMIPGANVTQPALYAQSQELYILAYPINPSGIGTDPQTLIGGYQPQCNPCYHPGLPPFFAYHDHVLTGAPGLGNNGTAGEFKSPWKIILLVYDHEVIKDPNFQPIKDANDIDAAEAAGMFQVLPFGNDPTNPYEFDTGTVLICPLVYPQG
jgi:hypothetical protein